MQKIRKPPQKNQNNFEQKHKTTKPWEQTVHLSLSNFSFTPIEADFIQKAEKCIKNKRNIRS
jgi:hypothetical protein